MDKKKTIMAAMLLSGTVGFAPAMSWAQAAPQGTRQADPEQSRPDASEKPPGTRSGATQELSTSDMRLVQQRLQEKGYSPGNTNGLADETTRAAIRKFQQDQGIPVTGTIDERTANQLGFEYSRNPASRGSGGESAAPSEQPSPR
jgi:peptidoglycan hydrolase-like protein with peptidoglycan-binding domain